MKALDEFVIRFSGLRQGLHEFDFKVNDKFFSCFENSEITKGELDIKVEMDKKSVLLMFYLEATGNVELPCDRCGDDFKVAIDTDYEFIVKLGNEESQGEDEVVFLPLQEYEINIAQQIYEMISLAVPFQRVHPDGECNSKALKMISVYDAARDKNKKEIDPRWDALKALKKKK